MAIVPRGGHQVKERARIVGFDCGEDEHSAVLLDASGEFDKRLSVVNERGQIQEALAELLLEVGPDSSLVVVVESKRSHGRIVADVAIELGCELWQVNTVALNHFRDLEGQPRKDDEWDAYLGARMVYLRMGGCREAIVTTDEERSLSRLTRIHSRVTEDRKRYVARLRAVLLELAPQMLHAKWKGPQPDSKGDVVSAGALAWLRRPRKSTNSKYRKDTAPVQIQAGRPDPNGEADPKGGTRDLYRRRRTIELDHGARPARAANPPL
jgi:hypothetical protein